MRGREWCCSSFRRESGNSLQIHSHVFSQPMVYRVHLTKVSYFFNIFKVLETLTGLNCSLMLAVDLGLFPTVLDVVAQTILTILNRT